MLRSNLLIFLTIKQFKQLKTMAQLISLSIDLLKIDRSKIIHGKNGAEYYPITISVNDEKDQYDNDVSSYDSQSKEQRDAKEKRNYLGNGKTIWKSPVSTPVATSNEAPY